MPISRRLPPLPLLGERERFVDARAAAPEHDDHRAQPPPVTVLGRVSHDGDDLLDGRRVGSSTKKAPVIGPGLAWSTVAPSSMSTLSFGAALAACERRSPSSRPG
jgi:hypothetical protein